jgi:hypothetical protein
MSEQKTNSFSIIELLQYVRKNAQTGRLLFQEKGSKLAELYFSKGHLVHATNDKVQGDDVVYQLLGNKTAEIRWERNIASPEETVSKTDEVLLLGALGILTEDDAANVMDVVSQEAEQAMATTFEDVPTAPEPVIPGAPPSAETVPAIPIEAATTPSKTAEPMIGAPEAGTGSVLNSSTNTALEGMGRLQAMLGDEVLRPPRFRRWTGLPLPFVSAYAFDPSNRQLKTSYDLLWREKFSGILAVVYGQTEALTLLYRGRAVHSRYAEGRTFFKDQNALRRIVELTIPASEKNVVLIYPLEPEFVHSYAALIMGEPELTGLSSQSVKINKLLNTLEQAQRTGVVHVSNNEENGYIFLHMGHKLGSYYEVEDVLEESILRVYQIVGKNGSIIDVLTSPQEDRLFEYASRPKSAAEVKQQIIEIAEEIFGKRSNRVVQLVSQAEDNGPALKTYCNQARRVAQMFIDRSLADQFYERAMFLLQELN